MEEGGRGADERADRFQLDLLARVLGSQVQAKDHQDHAVPHQDEEAQDEGSVRPLSLPPNTSTDLSPSPQLVPIKKKLERRENARESKALTAARLEKSLERELIARLKSRAYGDQPLNINEDVWRAVLNREKEVEAEGELEALGMESDEETDESDEEALSGEGEFVSDLEESDIDDMEESYEMDGQEVRRFLSFARARAKLLTGISLVRQYNSGDDNSDDSGTDESEEGSDDDGSSADASEDEAPMAGKRKAVEKKGKGPVLPKKPRRSAFLSLCFLGDVG